MSLLDRCDPGAALQLRGRDFSDRLRSESPAEDSHVASGDALLGTLRFGLASTFFVNIPETENSLVARRFRCNDHVISLLALKDFPTPGA